MPGSSPASVVNRALDAIGRSDLTIGDLSEGTEAAKPALRAYGPALRQLLRTAHWDFARKQAPLTLLADATGQSPGVGTMVQAPWSYCYALPVDSMKFRFLPWNTNPVTSNPPIMTGLAQPPLNAVRLVPARFVIALEYNYPMESGFPSSWDQIPDWASVSGGGPTSRTVINTNVPPTYPTGTTPQLMPAGVYTAFVPYPSEWDSLFEEALVQLLASRLAMPLAKDPRFGLEIQKDASAKARDMIMSARATNGNESAFAQTTDHTPDWLRARDAGAGWNSGGFGAGGGGSAYGTLWGGYDACSFGDGSSF